MPCPACKIIIDGGRTAASADLLADTVGPDSPIYGPARYLANVVRSDVDGVVHAITTNAIAHSHLPEPDYGCHRATEIRAWVDALRKVRPVSNEIQEALDNAPFKLLTWADEDFANATAIIAGVKGDA